MNKAKLSALCAKARGLTYENGCYTYPANDGPPRRVIRDYSYNPIDDANQADDLLTYVADGLGWGCGYDSECKNYWCRFVGAGEEVAETQNLAKILCSLRASDKVTDAEIEEALK